MRRTRLRTEKYGPLDDQVGDLHMPAPPHPPVVCLLHGGFWRMPYGRDQLIRVVDDLTFWGYAVWNLEYRRLGTPGAGWPGTFEDVIAGVEHLTNIAGAGVDLDLNRAAVVGHSAGGQLALWLAARHRSGLPGGAAARVRIKGVAGEAAVADLTRAFELGVGGTAVAELMGGTPAEQPARYQAASPRALLPLGLPQLILHGTRDDVVPIEIARSYTEAARAAGDEVEFEELHGAGHMDFLDPNSEGHEALRGWLYALFVVSG
jgi:acetyl esterase/lipase